MLSSRNEWIAIGVLLVWIAFVPCPPAMKEFYATPLGKLVAFGAVVYAWKFLSPIVAVLLLVAILRSGSIREFLDETGVAPTNFKCEDTFVYVADKKMCAKGNEMKAPVCNDASMMWDSEKGECVPKAAPPPATPPPATSGGAGGPEGGTSPGAAAAMNEMANAKAEMTTPGVEGFVGYQDKKGEKYAPA